MTVSCTLNFYLSYHGNAVYLKNVWTVKCTYVVDSSAGISAIYILFDSFNYKIHILLNYSMFSIESAK